MHEPLTLRTILKFVGIGVGALLILSYIVFQARFLIIGPQIALSEEPSPLQNDRQIFLAGNAHNISHLWLNDRPIFTDAKGNFNEALVLEDGYTVTTLRAEDRYGRETKIQRVFVYTPASFIR